MSEEEKEAEFEESNKYCRTVFVYSNDGTTLIQVYSDVKSISHVNDKYIVELRHRKSESKDEYTVSFSDKLSYVEIENWSWLSHDTNHRIAQRMISDCFINSCINAGIIKRLGAGYYTCDAIGMPKTRGLSNVLNWIYSKTRDADPLPIEKIVETLMEELKKALIREEDTNE